MIDPPYHPVTPQIVQQLEAIVGPANFSTADHECQQRAFDVSGHAPHPSEVVVWPTTAEQVAEVLQFANQMLVPVTLWGAGTTVHCALKLGGTATGEHGVGIGKIGYMVQEHSPALDVMRSIKQTLDPNNILNPGKIFPQGNSLSKQHELV